MISMRQITALVSQCPFVEYLSFGSDTRELDLKMDESHVAGQEKTSEYGEASDT